MSEDWSVYDLGQHTAKCAIWASDVGVCDCGGNELKWRGKANGVPHPNWYDGEVVRRLITNESVGRPVSESEARAAIPELLSKSTSVLEMSERMGVDRRWVDEWVKEYEAQTAYPENA